MACLATVLYPSPTPEGWTEWTHQNYQHHLAIEDALLQVRGVRVTPFRIWPVDNMKDWEGQHQQAHDLFCEELGIQGIDLTGLDLRDKSKKDAWFFQHYMQHYTAAQILGTTIL